MRPLSLLTIMLLMVVFFAGCGGGGGGGAGGDSTAPTVSITSPTNGATVNGITTVTATASDNADVTKVEFYLDGVLQFTDTLAPYAYSWNTATKNDGSYTLSARAYDAANNIGASASVGVTVSNPNQKTATLVISSQSATPSDVFGGFDLTVTLPAGASLKTDNTGVPLASVVYLSGALAGSTLSSSGITYDAVQRVLTISFPSSNSYSLGEFLTVKCDVPNAYTPNVSQVNITSTFYAPGIAGGGELPSITTSASFN